MIKWETIVDPDDGLREYKALIGGIDFHIWHALEGSRHSFGLSACRPLPDGRNEQVKLRNSYHVSGIMWAGTLRNCKALAERIYAQDQGEGQ